MNKKNMNGRGSKNPGKTLMRLLSYVWNYYKVKCVFVALAIQALPCLSKMVL